MDPERRRVLVDALRHARYEVQGEFQPGQQATSVLLPDFAIDVRRLFTAMDDVPE